MQKLQNFLVATLGRFGLLLFYAISIGISVYPLIMFNMSWWLYMLLALGVQLIVIRFPFGLEVLWIVGFVGAILGPQDVFTIIYYVLFVIIVGPTILNLLVLLLTLRRK